MNNKNLLKMLMLVAMLLALFQLPIGAQGYQIIESSIGDANGIHSSAGLVEVNGRLDNPTFSGSPNRVDIIFNSPLPSASLTANNNYYNRNQLNDWQIKISNLLTNATNPGGGVFSLASLSLSTNGVSLSIDHGYVQYLNTNLVVDQFTYTVTNSAGASAQGVITLGMNPSAVGGQFINFALTNGVATMTLLGVPAYLYHVQLSTNLSLSIWTTLATTNAPSNGEFQFSDLNPPQPQAFYRLMWNSN